MKNEDVKKFLPHRDPFLFIDKVVEISNEIIIAERYISPKETFFKGHFPNFPIMPGVLVLEAMAQSCALLGSHIMSQAANDKSMYLLCGVEKVRFKKKVLPGDTLIFKSSVISSKRGIWKFKSSAYSEEKLVCSAEILCADRSLNE
jgi:3-hydroxyacyl-[acyl-carrier-protein] dehydratase